MNRLSVRIIFAVLGFSFAYAIVRYQVFKGVDWAHFPMFIANKAISFSGLLLLIISASGKLFRRQPDEVQQTTRKFLGRTGFVLIILHVVLSFMLFRPEVYDKFFTTDGSLNAMAEWSMLLGSLGLIALMMIHSSYSQFEPGNRFKAAVRARWFNILMLLVSTLHVALMGFEGWLTPGDWHGGLPSFTLLITLAFVAGLFLIPLKKQA